MRKATSADILGNDSLEGLEKPTALATGLPGQAYTDQAIFELEQKSIFTNSWFAAGYSSDIPKSGDKKSVTIAGWELLLVRGKDNNVRCFHNICSHRGSKLVEGCKSGNSISCPYHCWTYNLDGELIGTPHLGGPGVSDVEGMDRKSLGLRQVRCDTWQDLLFVDISGEAPSLADHFTRLNCLLADYELDEVTVADVAVPETELPFNWKLLVEGGIESYHLPWVHPQLELPPKETSVLVDEKDAYIGHKIPLSIEEMRRRAANSETEASPFPTFRKMKINLENNEPINFYIIFLMPNAVVLLFPNYFILNLIRPVSVTKTFQTRKIYYLGDAAVSPELSVKREEIAEVWKNVLAQDIPFLVSAQEMAAVRKRMNFPTRFSPFWEIGLHRFQKYVARNITL
ncbi:Rieske 2Fe-2S domain-containing protein [Sneathiella chungangensis]|uniref:Rieske 2Fe-2S domain-containing protein n=1 Tax=Sneathiella chungangensis TaxID=1418234 RepID=A0A845MCZ4_9PROT|nr:aromatic ring-hydroxylating dioxygenase subunit alpha [Sneathiella chungangensis]MZR21186.1 Rieske 2Fe-2S domain-containing protein [Sneathiella chungangensis]